MREITQKLYQFSELSEQARERALCLLSDINVNYDWYNFGGLLEFSDYDTTYFLSEEMWQKYKSRKKHLFHYYNFYFDIENPYIQFNNLTVEDDEIFFNYLQIPEELSKKVKYYFSCPRNQEANMFIMFKPLEELTLEESVHLEQAQEIFDGLLCDAIKVLKRQYDFLTSKEAISETIKAENYEFFADGSPYMERRELIA